MKHDFSWDGWPARAIGARCDRVIGVSEAVLRYAGEKLGITVPADYTALATE